MAEKLGLGPETRTLRIGQSYTNPKSSAFHSIKYDFKPASVDTNKIATVDVGNNHQVTVTVPHLDGAGVPQTVFKGSQRPYQKECVLIIDRVTGEVTLEKLACNIQVKKTRAQSSKLPVANATSAAGSRSQTPPVGGQRISNKTKVTSGSRRADRQITHLVPKHSPLHASPNYPSPNQNRDTAHNNPSALASLPMIGVDDFDTPTHLTNNNNNNQPTAAVADDLVGEITDTSSSSDSDSDGDRNATVVERTNGHHSNGSQQQTKMAAHLLDEDLCLSESGSDSD